jgi:hypothetical protein
MRYVLLALSALIITIATYQRLVDGFAPFLIVLASIPAMLYMVGVGSHILSDKRT